MKLIMLTGFLGAGKTTLLQHLLTAQSGQKIGVLMNEFGEINVDARLIEKEGVQMAELSNGSIFCACIKDKFVDGLIEMSYHGLDLVLIEATGLADPSSMSQILGGIRHKLKEPYDYRGSICVVDGEHFLGLYDLLPAIRAQLEYCSAVLVNKADRMDPDTLGEVLAKLQEVNPEMTPLITSYCRVDVQELMQGLDPTLAKAQDPRDSTNTVVSRPATFILKGGKQVSYQGLKGFLSQVSPQAYRVKGFVDTDNGPFEVSCVGEQMELNAWSQPLEDSSLVVISAMGFKMMSLLIEAIETHVKGSIWI